MTCYAPAPDSTQNERGFGEALAACLQETRRCAHYEVGRLEEVVATLRSENEALSLRLRAMSGISPRSIPCPEIPLVQNGLESGKASDEAPALSSDEAPPPARQSSPLGSEIKRRVSKGSDVSGASSPQPLCPVANPEEVKQMMRSAMTKKLYNVKDHYKTTGFSQRLARSNWFDQVTTTLILCNAVWMAVELDTNDADSLGESHAVYQVTEHCFCSFFTFELIVRFIAFEQKLRAFVDPWFAFDLALVLLMVMEDWAVPLLGLITGREEGVPLGDAVVMRLFRLVRLTRITRMMRVMPELMIMVKGMVAAMRSVSLALLLMASMTYMFAIAFRQLTSNTELGDEYFKSVPGSAYTLIVEGMIPDNGDMMSTLGDDQWGLGFLFFVFLFMAALTIMNMLIGILCQVVSNVSDMEEERLELARLSASLEFILSELDGDYDGLISKSELTGMLAHPKAVAALQSANVDVYGLVDNAEVIFDQKGKEAMEFEEFIDVLQQFRGTTFAAVKAMTELRKFLYKTTARIEIKLRDIEMSVAKEARARMPEDKAASVTAMQDKGRWMWLPRSL